MRDTWSNPHTGLLVRLLCDHTCQACTSTYFTATRYDSYYLYINIYFTYIFTITIIILHELDLVKVSIHSLALILS